MLFIGLSFKDGNLKELIESCKEEHPSSLGFDEPIGFYFVLNRDINIPLKSADHDKLEKVKENIQKMDLLLLDKIYPIKIDNWKEIPYILCRICQKAILT